MSAHTKMSLVSPHSPVSTLSHRPLLSRFFEVLECFRRQSLSAALVFISPGSAAQGIFAVIISALSLWLYASCKQFPTPSANRLGATAQMTLFLIMQAGLMIQMDVSEVSAWLGFVNQSLPLYSYHTTAALLLAQWPYYGRAVVGSMAPPDAYQVLFSARACFSTTPPTKTLQGERD